MSSSGQASKARQILKVWGGRSCPPLLKLIWIFGNLRKQVKGGGRWRPPHTTALPDGSRFGAELVECFLQLGGNIHGLAMLDVAALHHVDNLSVAQQGNRGRRWWVSCKIRAGPIGSFLILTGKNTEQLLRPAGVLQRSSDRRPHAPGGASADRVHHYHGRARLIRHGAINISRGAEFFDAEPGQLFAHRNHHDLWIHFFSSGSFSVRR